MKRATTVAGLVVVVTGVVFTVSGCPFVADYGGYDSLAATGSGGGGAAAVCGNGKLETGEACDDGNDLANDGCMTCAIEDCFGCTGDAGETSTCDALPSKTTCQGTKFCNDVAQCVECIEDLDCSANPNGYCYQGTCASCSDLMQNGDETGIDCGDASRCGLCNGTACPADPTMCHSGVCADGLCCDSMCVDTCKSCMLAGNEGICTNVLAGDTDDTCQMMNKACDAVSMCVNGAPNGTPCAVDANCISMKCTNSVCVSP